MTPATTGCRAYAALIGERDSRAATNGLLAVLHSQGGLVFLRLAARRSPRSGRWIGAAAVALDLLDGRLARRMHTASPFGRYADALADAAVWTWLALRVETAPCWQRTGVVLWAAPVAAATGLSLARGRMMEVPRPVLLPPAAAMQAVIAARRLLQLGDVGLVEQNLAAPAEGRG